MRVSVAMCTYNGEQFLHEQLLSIRDQTHPPAELVICDDGSTDRTEVLVEEFRQTAAFPVRWFRNPVNLGSTKNFNQAIALCTGDAIALCDQDDLWMPEKLAVCVRALSADTTAAGVFSNAQLIGEDGELLKGDLWRRMKFHAGAQQEFLHDGASFLGRRDTVTGAALVFRSTFVDRLLPAPEEWVHDGWIAFVLASLAHVQALPERLLAYRLHRRQQVGAAVVPWRAHLHTKQNAALEFHRFMVRRFTLLQDHMERLAADGAPVSRSARVEVQRRVRFEQARVDLLETPRTQRILPAIARLKDYRRYEKGVLSLLRDMTHNS